MKNKPKEGERRKCLYFSWNEYVGTLAVLGILGALPAIMYGADIRAVKASYFLWYLLYWAVISGFFCIFTSYQKYRTFDKPLHKLSDSAKKVAEGDFSVFIEPLHTSDKLNYIDYMFQDFNKMVEELGTIDTLKNDFIANVSHEIKTPLSVIQNYAAALYETDLAEDLKKDYIDTIVSSGKNLTTLVTNILKLNKLENQEIVPVTEPFDLCRQLCECIILFDMELEQKNIELKVEIEDRVMIWADAGMLEIVWYNLISNAVKFTEPGGIITLTQTSEEDSVEVSLTDTGCGMAEETMKHIFDKFYQGDTSHSKEGNGLGLALALRVIELAGGTITVKSKPGKGTTFTVRLETKL
ncbi:Signal transduction histidine kinase [Anaerocolumna jejuensis DSM 15929]|uniref:histidine kinase n=1 Tax=Anaerocolumna jejuensis DSM 15929 TaxID=1121322 RepID=A0A1M6JC90_9FIRM|nr:HAMP domain-containing sensor histidine kinase [Anaerocolumna jejuensis]SHJ44325.1 Signal transduction histidine kinase [Anaerocolumna jejuensis DSM 15929]